MLDVKDKIVTIIGFGKSGLAAAKLLAKLNAKVKITDAKPAAELTEYINALNTFDVEIETDGHTIHAIEGSELIIVSPGVPVTIPVLVEAANRGIPIISELELGWQYLKNGHKVVGITGSNGKTTTTTLIGEILKNSGLKVFVGGNIGMPLSEKVLELSEDNMIVLEISSFQLETIKEFRPDISVCLNITPDHLDRYNSINEYIQTKLRIFENQTVSDVMVLNADYEQILSLTTHKPAKPLYFSRKKRLNKDGVYLVDDKIVTEIYGKTTEICNIADIRIPGPYNLENAMAAVAIAMVIGVDKDIIRHTLMEFKGVEHRLELVDIIDDIKFINDSKATNVDSVICALNSFPAPIILIAGGKDKGCDYTRLKPLLDEKVKAMVLFGEAADRIERECKFEHVYRVSSLCDAVRKAYECALSGDIVLFSPACSSFDMFRNFEERGHRFKQEVKRLRYSNVRV
jgi:UDP-N-acetylmuramoylalanine--D-glutamate ligase